MFEVTGTSKKGTSPVPYSAATEAIQYLLINRYKITISGGIDGKFGAGTETAVKKFQEKQGITADGKVGNTTWSHLFGHSATSSSPPSDPVLGRTISDGVYYIKNNNSGKKYLDFNTSTNEAIQYSFLGPSYQLWRVTYNKYNGYYTLTPIYNESRSLRGTSDAKAGSAVTLVANGTLTDSYYWHIKSAGTGKYKIVSKNSKDGKGLTVKGNATGNSAKIVQETASGNGTASQQWIFEEAHVKLSGYKTFSAIDGGDGAKNEVELVQSKLSGKFTKITVLDNTKIYRSAQTMKEAGRYSDILYLNGHGDWGANLAVLDSRKVDWIEYLSAVTPLKAQFAPSIPKTGVGANFKSGSTTKTDSYWNTKAK